MVIGVLVDREYFEALERLVEASEKVLADDPGKTVNLPLMVALEDVQRKGKGKC